MGHMRSYPDTSAVLRGYPGFGRLFAPDIGLGLTPMLLTVRRKVGLLAAMALLAAPLAAWALWKPIRALAPELAGVKCFTGDVCTDDPSKMSEALLLRQEAMQFVQQKAGGFKATPRMIFCSTPQCEKTFGFTSNAAYSVGSSALVVSARGWQPYYIRHELIHCVQVERIGGFQMLLRTPTWLIEGMAYSMSEDPRRPLREPFEGYRAQYEAWANQVSSETLWQRAAEL